MASLDGEPEFWQLAAKGLLTDQDWIDGLEGRGYTAGVGEPINLFYPELMRIFPNAKIILNVRPVDDWMRSMRKAIIEPRSYLERPPISWLFSLFGISQAKQSLAEVRSKMADKWGFDYNLWSSVEAGDEAARRYFEEWNAKVIETVPKERLLVYNVEDGWGPLLNFLNISEVQRKNLEPFPSINDAETILVVVKGSYWLLVLIIPVIILLCTCKVRRRILERTCMKIMSLVKQAKDYKYYRMKTNEKLTQLA